MAAGATTNNILIGVLGLAAIACGVVFAHQRILYSTDPYADRHILLRGLDKPTIWLFYNDSDINNRQWLDFGARSGRVLNTPFLNLCYETILKHNSNNFKIEVIGGLSGLAERLGLENLPLPLQNMKKILTEADLNFARAAILAKFGGLWLTPGAICRRSFDEVLKIKEKNVFFGTDLDTTFSGPDGTVVPGLRAIWAYKPEHPVFMSMETATRKRLEEGGGGNQIRGDAKWDWTQFAAEDVSTLVRADAELARKGRNGKRLEIDDLLAAGGENVLHFAVGENVIYTPIPLDEVARRRNFGWFLRMSAQQILESDLAVSKLFRDALGGTN